MKDFLINFLKSIHFNYPFILDKPRYLYRLIYSYLKSESYSRYYNPLPIQLTSQLILKLPEKPKTLALVHSIELSGAEKLALELLGQLNPSQALIISTEKKWEYKKLNSQFEMIECLDKNKILKLIQDFNPDLILINHSDWAYKNLNLIKSKTKAVVCDFIHAIEFKKSGYPDMSGKNTAYIDYHICVSKSLGGYLVDKYKADVSKIYQYRYQISFKALPSRSKQLNHKKITLLYIGRLSQIKRPYYLKRILLILKFLNLINRKSIQFELRIFGDGPFSILKKKWSAYPEIKFLGTEPDAEFEYKNADFLMMTSENEGLPLVIQEAQALGCAVVSTDVGQIRELLDAKSLVHPLFPELMAFKIWRGVLIGD